LKKKEKKKLGNMAIATGSQFCVLIVDDNLIDRKLIERLLKPFLIKVHANKS